MRHCEEEAQRRHRAIDRRRLHATLGLVDLEAADILDRRCVRWPPLFAYGRNLVQALREEDDPDDIPWYAFLTSIFGTTDPALITVTIIRGLLRAAALQARLSSSLARGRDLLLPLPLQKDRIAKRIDGGRGPGRGQPRAAGWTIPPGWPAGDHSLDREPTPEDEMFAEIVA